MNTLQNKLQELNKKIDWIERIGRHRKLTAEELKHYEDVYIDQAILEEKIKLNEQQKRDNKIFTFMLFGVLTIIS